MKRVIAIHLLVATALVASWFYKCPKYSVEGTETRHMYRTVRRSGNSVNTLNQPFRHRDPTAFWGGVSVILLGCASACLFVLSQDGQRPGSPPQEDEPEWAAIDQADPSD